VEDRKMEIKDSGMRRTFDSGAVRDVSDGKGRCDLLPLRIIGRGLKNEYSGIFIAIADFIERQDVGSLWYAAVRFSNYIMNWDEGTMLLELAKHMEEGSKKYPERNWEKGINIHCYIDSGVRHLLKHMAHWTDEPHERAFVWNMLCCIHTMAYHPELNDLPSIQNTCSKTCQSDDKEL
jgi:hypothetical protein